MIKFGTGKTSLNVRTSGIPILLFRELHIICSCTAIMEPNMFFDLFLEYVDQHQSNFLAKEVASLGYSGAAIAYCATADEFTVSLNRKDRTSKEKSGTFSPPVILDEASTLKTTTGVPFKIFRRLSVVVSDPRIFHDLANHPTCKAFDIISVSPTDEKMLQQAIDDVNVDIIELDFTTKRCVSIKRKHARQAEANGKFFEVCYRGALETPEARAVFFANCRRLVGDLNPCDSGKLPDVVIMSSGLASSYLLKSPTELSFLADLFGFPRQFSDRMFSVSSYQALQNSLAKRRTAKNAVQIL